MYCKYCRKNHQETDFELAGTINNKRYYRKKCRFCRYEEEALRKKNIRAKVDEYKKQSGCVICGYADPRALVFHHKNKDKKILNVSDLINYSIKKLWNEIKKCVVVCANCHSIHHYNERNGLELII